MGLDIRTAEFLLYSRIFGVDYKSTCTLGRQSLYLLPSERALIKKWTALDLRSAMFADEFFKVIGAKEYFALDSSGYEGADIIHNLNDCLPHELIERFDCVVDGGTLEHIFDFPSALRDSLRMVRIGGHLIICNMANNFMGHGFYQLSPELFFSAFTKENGCEVVKVLVSENGIWYEPKDPRLIGERVQAVTRHETTIFACIKRCRSCEPFKKPPHQSDYLYNLSSEDGSAIPQQRIPMTFRERLVLHFPILKETKKRLRDIKRGLFPRFPLLEEIDGRWKRWRGTKYRSLHNSKVFMKIGRRLLK